jgi:hypothetical protein
VSLRVAGTADLGFGRPVAAELLDVAEAEEQLSPASEALDLAGEMFSIERAFPDLRCIAGSTRPDFGDP